MSLSQLSIFLENKPGRLLEVTKVLSDAQIDIRAVSVADTKDFGILRLIVSDAKKAQQELEAANCLVSISEVICVTVSDEPGSLMKVIKMLSDGCINIEYMYAFLTNTTKFAYIVFQVTDRQRATQILKDAGVTLVSEEDVLAL